MLVLIVCLFLYSGQNESKPTDQKKQAHQTSTSAPSPSPQVPQLASEQGQSTPNNKDNNPDPQPWLTHGEWVMAVLTGIYVFLTLVYVVISGRTLRAILRQEKDSAEKFGKEITQLTKSADAMEKIVTTIDKGNRDVMRAYLSVVIGSAIYQMRREGQSDLRFEGSPHLVNNGNTQARNVITRIAAEILDTATIEKFAFPIPEAQVKGRAQVIGAHQSYILSGIVKNFVPDEEVAAIKEGRDKGLYVWGVVTYDDIFGESHQTKFCQQLTWWPDGTVYGYYIAGQNDAD